MKDISREDAIALSQEIARLADRERKEALEAEASIHMAKPYIHRNGEMEPPTVAGWYWWEDTREPGRGEIQLVRLYHGELCEMRWSPPVTVWGNTWTRWWGPVIPPWEQQP
jgi:hypothetical protein